MDEALIKHAQNDVDDDHGDEQQEAHVRGRTLKRRRGTCKTSLNCRGKADVVRRHLDMRDGIAQGLARGEIKGEGDGGNLPRVVDGLWPRAAADGTDRVE